MSYRIELSSSFKRKFKKLLKKYPSLKTDLGILIELLERKPHTGTALGKDCYKIRLAIKSKGKGKSGGARVITHIAIRNETVFLLTIYDKSQQSDLSQNELDLLLSLIDG